MAISGGENEHAIRASGRMNRGEITPPARVRASNLLQAFDLNTLWQEPYRPDESEIKYYWGYNQYDVAKALEVGDWSSEEEFYNWLKTERRSSYSALSRRKDNDWVEIGIGRHGIDSVSTDIWINSKSGLWIPQKSTYVLDGQNFTVREQEKHYHLPELFSNLLGEDKARKVQGPNRRHYSLVNGDFLPNYAAAEVIGGGTVDFLYFWDRPQGILTLEGVAVEHLREDGNSKKSESEWTKANGQDTVVVVKPYGSFKIPGRINERDWLRDIIFPRRYSWYDDCNGGRPEEKSNGGGYNFFGIDQVQIWEDIAKK